MLRFMSEHSNWSKLTIRASPDRDQSKTRFQKGWRTSIWRLLLFIAIQSHNRNSDFSNAIGPLFSTFWLLPGPMETYASQCSWCEPLEVLVIGFQRMSFPNPRQVIWMTISPCMQFHDRLICIVRLAKDRNASAPNWNELDVSDWKEVIKIDSVWDVRIYALRWFRVKYQLFWIFAFRMKTVVFW